MVNTGAADTTGTTTTTLPSSSAWFNTTIASAMVTPLPTNHRLGRPVSRGDGRGRRRNWVDSSRADDTVNDTRSEEKTPELQSLMRISYAVFCMKKKKHRIKT